MAKALVERDQAGGSWFKLREKRPSIRVLAGGGGAEAELPSEEDYKSRFDSIEA